MDALTPRAPAKGSALYRRFGDGRAMLFGPHALLLQVAHPVVSAGVVEHSVFREQAWRRLTETVLSTSAWAYGGEEGARLEAARLRAMHTHIAGTLPDGARYTSLAPSPWTWVYATLIKSSIDAQQYFGRPIPRVDLDELYHQARELGLLLGIRAQDLPSTWDGFVAYVDTMIDEQLQRTEGAEQVIDFLRHITRPRPLRFLVPTVLWRVLIAPVSWLALLVTAGTLPPGLRDRLGLPWSPGRQRLLGAFRGAVRAGYLLTPPRLRYLPAVWLGRFQTRRLREQARRERETRRMMQRGEWDPDHPWAWVPPAAG